MLFWLTFVFTDTEQTILLVYGLRVPKTTNDRVAIYSIGYFEFTSTWTWPLISSIPEITL